MRFRTDDRAVTVQIGTVLLFAVLIVLVSLYQASVVPQQNEEVEFNHNQQVQSELQDLRNELRRTAVTGTGGSTTVTLGTRYPVRAFFVNPAPPSGTLRTTEAANLTVDNAVADGEVFDYWNGSARRFSTAGLVYDPDYSEYQRPPTTVYRNGLLYNRFADANLTLGGQRLVQGDRISLVAVDGTLSEAGSGAESVDVQPVSTATRTVTVSNESASEPVTLVVPTSLSGASAVELWSDSLVDQSRVETVEAATLAGGQSAVRVVLEPGSYELELAKVGVGTDVTGVDAHYVTVVRGDNASVPTGSNQQVVVEVRDRFNNPVSGATVNVSDPSAPVTPTQAETDSDGRATFVYAAPEEAGTERVAFNISDAPLPRETATAELFVGGGSGSGGGNDTYDVNWTAAAGPGLDCEATVAACTLNANDGTSVDLTANVTADDAPVSQATVDYAVNNSSLGSVTPGDGTTDQYGGDAATLDVAAINGTITAYAASGDDVDQLRVRVVDPETGVGDDPVVPTLEQFIVSDESVCSDLNPGGNCRGNADSSYAQYTADWEVSDEGGSGLSSVTVSLVAPGDTVADSRTYSVSGNSATGTTTLSDDGGFGDEYTVEITASDGADNTVTASVTDTADGEGGGGAGEDPGFAYEDVDGDGTYDPETDGTVSASELDGSYEASDGTDLVVPDSTDGSGELSLTGVDWSGESVYVGANVSSRSDVSIVAETGSVQIENRTIGNYAGGSGSGDLTVESEESVDVGGSTLQSKGTVELNGQSSDLTGTTIDTYVGGSGSGGVSIATDDEVTATDATVLTKADISVEAASVTASGASFDNYAGGSGSGEIGFEVEGEFVAESSTLDTKSDITITAASADLDGASLNNYQSGSGSGSITVTASSGSLSMVDAGVLSKSDLALTGTSLDLRDATADTSVGGSGSGDIGVTATAGDAVLDRSRLNAGAELTATVEAGTLSVDEMVILSRGRPATLANDEDAPVEGDPDTGTVG